MKRKTVDRDYELKAQKLREEIEAEIHEVNLHLIRLSDLTRRNIYDSLMTTQEVADFLRCSVQGIPEDLPCYRLNHKTILYNSGEVRLYVKNHQIN